MQKNKLKCKECGHINESTSYFCDKCGCFLKKDALKNPEIVNILEYKLARIMDNLQKVPHENITWNDTVDMYTKKVEKFKALYAVKDLQNNAYDAIAVKMEDFLDRCQKADFQIAFVGTIKTGKSTLINALLGKNYASVSVTPETAVLTKFRSSPRDYVKIQFYTSEEWRTLLESRTSGAENFNREYEELNADAVKDKWLDHKFIYKELKNADIEKELAIWTSSKQAEHYFVKEVEVGISSLPKDFPKQVVFVDTPGLSDPVAYRSDITKQYIRKANAVFVCVEAKKIYSEEVDTIASVFALSEHNKNKVHVVATHWDQMNDLVNDWNMQKEYLLKELVGDAFFDDRIMASKNIMPCSAYIYNLCRDYDNLGLTEKQALMMFSIRFNIMPTEESIKQNLAQFQDMTNIKNISSIIKNELISNYKTILYQDIERDYLDITFNLKRVKNDKVNALEQYIKTTNADLKEKKKQVVLHQKNVEEISTYQERLTAALTMVEKGTSDNVNKIKDFLKRKADEKVKR